MGYHIFLHSVLVIVVLSTHFALLATAQDFHISETGHAHFAPSIAADSAGNFAVVWSDARNSIENGGLDSGSAIYAQLFSADGSLIGGNFRISEISLGGGHRVPSISMNQDGDFIISWHGPSCGGVAGDADVYARRFRKDGVPVGPSFRVSDDSGTSAQIDAAVLALKNGGFVITWLDRRVGPLFSYAQFYDSTGTPQGSNFKVNSNDIPGVATLGAFTDGKFFFMWSGYLQIYSSDGFPISEDVYIGKNGFGVGIGMDSLLVIWAPLPQYNFFIRVYNASGIALTDSFKVERDDPVDNPLGRITVCRSKSGDIIAVWEGHRNDFPGTLADGDIYAQRYDMSLSPIGGNFKVNHEPEERPQRDPEVVFAGDNFVTVWVENLTPEQCLPPGVYVPPETVDVLGSVQSFNNPVPGDVFGWRTKRNPCTRPSQFTLHQNYPNPFNLETTIPFDVPGDLIVDITVYDLLGRSVQQLVHDFFAVGRYQVKFSAADLSSGVYFYRLSTDRFSRVRRMVIIK